MFVRDAAVSRVFLGPTSFFATQTLIQVAGQVPVMNAVVHPAANAAQDDQAPSVKYLGGAGIKDKSAKSKIPRPPNAFIIYRKKHHGAIVAQNPGVHNNKICKYLVIYCIENRVNAFSAVIIGGMWNRESAAVRADYKAQAERMKKEHLRKYPGYQYQPRKPSEKKRRMTKKKAAALAANAPYELTASAQLASRYPENAEADGEIVQNRKSGPGFNRRAQTATFPLSADALLQVERTNFAARQEYPDSYLPTADVADFGPADTYMAAQRSDEFHFEHPQFMATDLSDLEYAEAFEQISQAYELGFYDNVTERYQDENPSWDMSQYNPYAGVDGDDF